MLAAERNPDAIIAEMLGLERYSVDACRQKR
jgi:hypothetical protein